MGARVDGEHTGVVLVAEDPAAGELRSKPFGCRAVKVGLGQVDSDLLSQW